MLTDKMNVTLIHYSVYNVTLINRIQFCSWFWPTKFKFIRVGECRTTRCTSPDMCRYLADEARVCAIPYFLASPAICFSKLFYCADGGVGGMKVRNVGNKVLF
jgi:hypothetical protein